jgi:hypothetical protein
MSKGGMIPTFYSFCLDDICTVPYGVLGMRLSYAIDHMIIDHIVISCQNTFYKGSNAPVQ